MSRCKDCKSWERCSTEQYPYDDRFGKCEKFYQQIVSVGMEKGFEINFVYIEAGDDYCGFDLYVGANFGCIHFTQMNRR